MFISQVAETGGYSLVAVHRLLIVLASVVIERSLWGMQSSVVVMHRLSCPTYCGVLVPRPGIERMSPALAGRFLTTGPQGKSQDWPFLIALIPDLSYDPCHFFFLWHPIIFLPRTYVKILM